MLETTQVMYVDANINKRMYVHTSVYNSKCILRFSKYICMYVYMFILMY